MDPAPMTIIIIIIFTIIIIYNGEVYVTKKWPIFLDKIILGSVKINFVDVKIILERGKIILAGGKIILEGGKLFWQGRWENYFGRWKRKSFWQVGVALLDMPNSNRFNILLISIFSKIS